MKIICSKCKQEKDSDEFNYNSSRKRFAHHCKKCHSDYLKSHYQRNKKYYKDKAKKRVDEIREWFVEYKSKLKCIECGESHPSCIEFHHKNKDEKELEISDAIGNGWTQKRILTEIKKCDVLCSNCHRKRHWNEKTGPWVWRKSTQLYES